VTFRLFERGLSIFLFILPFASVDLTWYVSEKAIAAFSEVSALIDGAIGGDLYDLDQLSSGEFKGTTRGDVFRVAGDPKGIEAELLRKGNEKADGTGGIVVSAVLWEHAISDVACVAFDVGR
jgi:hypothetical protein